MSHDQQRTKGAGSACPAASHDDRSLIAALRRGDETAFSTLLNRYHTAMIQLAMIYVPNRAVAEEVVQETWLGLLEGIDLFEGRSSLKTWLFRILTNQARRRGALEGRSIPFSALSGPGSDPAVDSAHFHPLGHEGARHWATPPRNWGEAPEERLLSAETGAYIRQAIDTLSPRQREVITLRDVVGWPAAEVCRALAITEANQRVLLHRARAKVRSALAQYLQEG